MKQEDALAILKTGASVFLTGQPGSGKTHTVNRYVADQRERGISVAVTASTGIAATHLNGRTVHSWSGIGVRETVGPDDLRKIAENKRVAGRIRAARVLVVDEISMLPGATLNALDAVCRHVRANIDPFGGLQVILVGDFFQLPPVRRRLDAQTLLPPETQADEIPFAFNASAWRSLNPAVCYLTEQHRQDDATFLSVLNAIRTDAWTDTHRARLRERLIAWEDAPPKCTRLFPHNRSVDRINDEELRKLNVPSRVFEMRRLGPEPLVQGLEAGCLSPARLELKKGAAVMFTKNDPQGRYVNGTLGAVTDFDDDGDPVVSTRSGRTVVAERAEWTAGEGDGAAAKLIQTPLRLAWAITVHKSQGMSLDAAVIDLSGAFEYGHGYVALSRVRSLAGLHLLGWNERALRVHPLALERDAEFRARSDRARAHLATFDAATLAARHRAFLEKAAGASGASGGRLDEVRKTHGNANRPWTEEAQADVMRRHEAKETIDAIAEALGRKPGAIRSRLKKLGVLP